MRTLSIGGVPEHFNLPWLRLIDSGELRDLGVDAVWQDYPGGSGAMGAALNDATLDVAMLLTEGAVAGIANGASYRIVSLYTETPLIWGIHVPAASEYQNIEDIRGARYAISRFGSGSHLMAFAHARHVGWPVGELRFESVGNLAGAVTAFENRTADVFLWERFMTQPLVDGGQFRRIGEYAAPWPAFVVCASPSALRAGSQAIGEMLSRVFRTAASLRAAAGTAAEVERRYGLKREDAVQWLERTSWASQVGVHEAALSPALDVLRGVGLVPPDGRWELIAEL